MATLVAPERTSPIDDAHVIKKACKGLGTDEKAIISLLGHRNSRQIKQIKMAYQEVYQEDLMDQLKCEISGDFEDPDAYRYNWFNGSKNFLEHFEHFESEQKSRKVAYIDQTPRTSSNH